MARSRVHKFEGVILGNAPLIRSLLRLPSCPAHLEQTLVFLQIVNVVITSDEVLSVERVLHIFDGLTRLDGSGLLVIG